MPRHKKTGAKEAPVSERLEYCRLLAAASPKKTNSAKSKDRKSRRLWHRHRLTCLECGGKFRSILGGQCRRRNWIGGIVIQRAKNRGVAAIQETIVIEIAFRPGMTRRCSIVEQSAEDGAV